MYALMPRRRNVSVGDKINELQEAPAARALKLTIISILIYERIAVSQAQASMQKSYIKVEIELRDTGYPGSRYTLIYDQPNDRLIGFYYHAVSGQNFDVVFVRQK
jgi:hypothetical protein